jgi:hypothetical protein
MSAPPSPDNSALPVQPLWIVAVAVLVLVLLFAFLPEPRLQQAVTLIVGLAWPVVVFLIVWLFQSDISQKVRDLVKWGFGKMQAEFQPAQPQRSGDPASPGPISSQSATAPNVAEDAGGLPIQLSPDVRAKLEEIVSPPYRNVVREQLQDLVHRLPLAMQRFSLQDREAAIAYASELAASLHLEKASRFIFRSQIEALETLKGRTMMTRENFRPFYDNATKTAPEVYKQYDFEMWMNYLKNMELISDLQDRVQITNAGATIAQYMFDSGYGRGLENA